MATSPLILKLQSLRSRASPCQVLAGRNPWFGRISDIKLLWLQTHPGFQGGFTSSCPPVHGMTSCDSATVGGSVQTASKPRSVSRLSSPPDFSNRGAFTLARVGDGTDRWKLAVVLQSCVLPSI